MMDLLTPIGFTLLTAENGHVALHLARQNHIDLLLLDVAMPEMSGWELLRQLRNKGQLAPVIMISAEADEVNAAISLAKGKFATWLNRCVSLYYWRTSVKYCISSGARNVSRQSSRKYMNHARSLPVSRLSR
jgi:CheY-like chemotaxis protein